MSKRFGRKQKRKLTSEINRANKLLEREIAEHQRSSYRVNNLQNQLCRYENQCDYRSETLHLTLAPDLFNCSPDLYGFSNMQISLDIKRIILGSSFNRSELLLVKNDPRKFAREIGMRVEGELIGELPKILMNLS